MKSFIVLFIALFAAVVFEAAAIKGDTTTKSSQRRKTEKELARYIIYKYSADGVVGRPVKDSSKPVNVNLTIYLNEIFEEPDDSLGIGTYFMMKWFDEYIGWNPAEWSGIDQISIPIGYFWHPDISSWNDFNDNWADQFRALTALEAWIHSNGKIIWYSAVEFRDECAPENYEDLKHYRNCTFIMGSQAHTLHDIEMFFEDNLADFNISMYTPTYGLEILQHFATKTVYVLDIPEPDSPWSALNYELDVKITPESEDKPKVASQRRRRRSIAKAAPGHFRQIMGAK